MESDQLFNELHCFTDSMLNFNNIVKLRVGGKSMYPILKSGDEITIERSDINSLKKGDIIVFKNAEKWVCHRLHKIIIQDNSLTFSTKGDSCKCKDKLVFEEEYIGKVISRFRRNKNEKLDSIFCKISSWLIIHFPKLSTLLITILLWFNSRLKRYNSIFFSLYKNLLFLNRIAPKLSIINIFVNTILGILPFLIIYLIKKLIDSISKISMLFDKSEAYQIIVFLLVFTGLIFIIQSILSILGSETRTRLSQSISIRIYDLLHKKYSTLDIAYLEDSNQQDKIHRAVQEAGFRPMKMENEFLSFFQSITSSVIIAIMLFSIHWALFFLLFIAIIPGFILRLKYALKQYKINVENSKNEREMNYYNRILTGVSFYKELRLFDLEVFFSKRFNNIQSVLHKKKNLIMRRQAIADIFAQSFAIAVIFISFGYITYLKINGDLMIGTVVLFFLVIQKGFSVMKDFFQSIAGLINDNVYLNDFFDFLNLPQSQNIHKNKKKIVSIKDKITIDNVFFQYPSSQRNALNSVSMTIPKGKTVALVGANGSGKTTLVKLLCGFYSPDSGRILFDDVNIAEYNISDIRTQVTAVFQDFALYNLTAKENIYMGNIQKEISDFEIKQAAKDTGIDKVIENLPNGYENVLGNLFEKGEELSIGQWQKLAIAKAFYRDAPILIMDEPSSALDAETELQILNNLKLLAKNKTTLIISHRFSTIQWVDLIYVLDEGKVVESGNHEFLMSLKGKYYSLFQASKFE